jgi:hypothetical protein
VRLLPRKSGAARVARLPLVPSEGLADGPREARSPTQSAGSREILRPQHRDRFRPNRGAARLLGPGTARGARTRGAPAILRARLARACSARSTTHRAQRRRDVLRNADPRDRRRAVVRPTPTMQRSSGSRGLGSARGRTRCPGPGTVRKRRRAIRHFLEQVADSAERHADRLARALTPRRMPRLSRRCRRCACSDSSSA